MPENAAAITAQSGQIGVSRLVANDGAAFDHEDPRRKDATATAASAGIAAIQPRPTWATFVAGDGGVSDGEGALVENTGSIASLTTAF